MQLVLRTVSRLCYAHLRHRHLGHIDERLNAVMPRNSSGINGCFQIVRRDRHAEIDAFDAFHCTMHRGEVGQIANDDFSAELAQSLGPLIFPAHEGADFISALDKHRRDVASYGTKIPGRPGDEDRLLGFGVDVHFPHPFMVRA